jgi:glycosyltransferase involved in cell wall biosynthesis/protein-tyrosine-phosphatase
VSFLPVKAVPGSAGAPRPLRVCHVVSADMWAGVEVQVATVASYLVERPEVKLTAVLLNEGWLARELRGLGVPVTVVAENEHGAIGTLTFLTRFLRDHDFDVVHTHRYKDTILGSIAARLAGVPHVIRTIHGLNEATRGWTRMKLRVYGALDQVVLRCCVDRIIAVSGRIAEALTASGHGPTKVVQVHNGVDLRKLRATRDREAVRRELGVGPGTCLIGTAGRLSPVKGHTHFLRAARLVLQKERCAKFIVIGGGPLKDELLGSARRLGIDRECLLLGPRTDVHDLVAAMDVFVLPSLDEGIPMALLEAMALGRPVVATAVGGVPEVVTHRANGLLVAPGDEQALADACLELALDPDRARRLGDRSRRVVEERFSHERNGQAVLDVYRQVATVEKRDLLRRGRRKLDHLVTRWRMTRLRCNPERVRNALRSAKSLLFVCHGNIIRSAFAARLIAQGLDGGRPAVAICSGGLEAVPGRPAHPTAVRTAAARRVDLSGHAAAPVTPEAVANADVIFVMDVPQLVALRRRFPDARAKTFLMTCLAPDAPLEIADPVDGNESRFEACFDELARAVPPLIRSLGAGAAYVTAPSALAIQEREA